MRDAITTPAASLQESGRRQVVEPPRRVLPGVPPIIPLETITPRPPGAGRRGGWVGRLLRGSLAACEWLFGLATLILGLAVLATVPLLQLLSLGYLLEAAGRVARTGRWTAGFVGIRRAARVGSVVLGTAVFLLPLRLVADLSYSAHLIDPGSRAARGWRLALLVLSVVLVGHMLTAWLAGGRLRHFFWPLLLPLAVPVALIRRSSPAAWIPPWLLCRRLVEGRLLADARDGLWQFLVSLRLPYYFWLGCRGFVGAVAWLFLPILLLVVSTKLEPGPAVLLGLLGGAALTVVLLYLPFLQTNFAADNRLVSMFDLGEARRRFRQAPLRCWLALLFTLLLALPLYLLKIEATYREVLWLPSLAFILLTYPARLLTGWAVGCARRRKRPAWWGWRWAAWLAGPPVAAAYVLLVYLTQYLSWYGSASMFEQHAFLLPVPFLGLPN